MKMFTLHIPFDSIRPHFLDTKISRLHVSEMQAMQTVHSNLTDKQKELQNDYSKLTKDRNLLETKCNDLTRERDQLQISHDALTKLWDECETSLTSLRKERDDLRREKSKLTAEKEELQKRLELVAARRDELQEEINRLSLNMTGTVSKNFKVKDLKEELFLVAYCISRSTHVFYLGKIINRGARWCSRVLGVCLSSASSTPIT